MVCYFGVGLGRARNMINEFELVLRKYVQDKMARLGAFAMALALKATALFQSQVLCVTLYPKMVCTLRSIYMIITTLESSCIVCVYLIVT